MKWKLLGTIVMLLSWVSLNGCVGMNTFPQRAQAGDTITIGIGLGYIHGGETDKMRPKTTEVIISDGGAVNYQLTRTNSGNGYVRSVFNLFPDPRSNVMNYNMWLQTPTIAGRPLETVVVVDLPADIPNGLYTVEVVSTSGAAGTSSPFITNLEIVGQGGSSRDFYDEFGIKWNLGELQNGLFGEVTFSPSATPVGAVELSISFDDTIVSPSDLRVVQPRINMDRQRLLFSRNPSAGVLSIYILSPEGVLDTSVLKFYLVMPAGTQDPNFVPTLTKVLDVDGNDIAGVTAAVALF